MYHRFVSTTSTRNYHLVLESYISHVNTADGMFHEAPATSGYGGCSTDSGIVFLIGESVSCGWLDGMLHIEGLLFGMPAVLTRHMYQPQRLLCCGYVMNEAR